jgi:hypothetical protein
MKAEIKVTFTDSKDYRLVPVTGAWGGPSGNGEIVVDFYVERTSPPEILMGVDDEEKIVEKVNSPKQAIRERQVGLVLRPDIALAIGNWLIEKANIVIKGVKEPIQ